MKLINATLVPDETGSRLLSMRREYKHLNLAAIKRAGRRKQRRFLRAELGSASMFETSGLVKMSSNEPTSGLVKVSSNEPTSGTHWMNELPRKVLRLFRVPSSYMGNSDKGHNELRPVLVTRKRPFQRTTVGQLFVA
jgi:hypothetical protein